MVRPAIRRTAVAWLRKQFAMSERRACGLVGLHRSTCRYPVKRTPSSSPLRILSH